MQYLSISRYRIIIVESTSLAEYFFPFQVGSLDFGGSSGGFSLLQRFGQSASSSEGVNESSESTVRRSKNDWMAPNPFKYDSSDDEDEDPKAARQNKSEADASKLIKT